MSDSDAPPAVPFASEDAAPTTTDVVSTAGASLARYGVLAFLAGLAFVLYIDRVCIGQAGKAMQEELLLTNLQWSYVGIAFTLSYTLFEVPTGHWGDVLGSRGVLIRIVLWWSAFTALTGLVPRWLSPDTAALPSDATIWWPLNIGFLILLVVRFLFGVGEAGAFPNTARVLSQWFPVVERGRAQGVVTTASLVGGAAANVLAAVLIDQFGWRAAFMIFGLLGVVWVAAFALWFRDDPAEHPSVNPQELAWIRAGRIKVEHASHAIPWGYVLTASNMWLMGLVMNCGAGFFYFLFTWYPTYLQKARDVPNIQSGLHSSLIMTAGAVACLSGGWLVDLAGRWTGERRWSRRVIGVGAFIVAGGAIYLSVQFDNPLVTTSFLALAFFSIQLHIPTWWSVVTDISGRHVGSMFGLMNSMGGIGAMAAPFYVGYMTTPKAGETVTRAMWDASIVPFAGAMLVAVVCWLLIDPARSIVGPQDPSNEHA